MYAVAIEIGGGFFKLVRKPVSKWFTAAATVSPVAGSFVANIGGNPGLIVMIVICLSGVTKHGSTHCCYFWSRLDLW